MENTGTESQLAPPGLKGVLVANTEIGSVRGEEGFYHYRQYDAADLATHRSLEAIWYLMTVGRLPTEEEERDFAALVGGYRVLEPSVLEMAAHVGRTVDATHLGLTATLPLVLGRGVSWLDESSAQFQTELARLAGAVPTLLGAILAGKQGREPLNGEPARSHAEDWVRLAAGTTDPTEASVRMVEVYLGLTVDHGFNASTFASRVAASAGADATACLTAGVSTLSGPLHGGAPSRALEMIHDIGDPKNTEAWIREHLVSGQKVMGFGHAVYRAGDPRSAVLKALAQRHGGDLVDRATEIEERALAELKQHRPGAVIVTNVEFFAGVVMALACLPVEAFTPSFTVSRVIGWTAHIAEQAGNNKIFRPSARYAGPAVAATEQPMTILGS